MARELGIQKLHAFKILKDGGYDTTPIPLKGAVTFETSGSYKDIEYNSDNTVERSTSILQTLEISLEMSSGTLAVETIAKLTGQEVNGGKIATVIGGEIPSFALAYEIINDEGGLKRRVLYNVNLQRESWSNDTDSDGEVISFTGKAIPIEYNGKKYIDLVMDKAMIEAMEDDTEKNAAQAEWDKWFDEVVMPN